MRHLLTEKLSAAHAPEFDQLRSDLRVNGSATSDEFISTFMSWISNDRLNQLEGIEEFTNREVCFGVTHFIDDLIMQYGEYSLQILEHDYMYYRRQWPHKEWSQLNHLVQRCPIIMALPFPGFGNIHPDMLAILDECLDKDIPIHLDCAWLPASRNIAFDFSHPAIKSFAISLSKGLGLDWNRIAVRFSRKKDNNNSITIANQFDMINSACLGIGIEYMNSFSFNFLWERYGEIYDQSCRSLKIRPTNVIHMAQEFGSGKPLGTRDLLLEKYKLLI